jgi:hypothetical protein
MKILSFFTRTFYNLFYQIKPPPMVQFWKKSESTPARLIESKDGSYAIQLNGEKYLYPGAPRGHVLTGNYSLLKKGIKNLIFNQAYGVIEKMANNSRIDMLPVEKMVPAVRHIWETFEMLEDCEIVPDMKARISLIKKVICQVLQEDDAYRFRAQLFLDLINQKKIRLSRADLYYARGKYWRPDRYKKLFGKVIDAFEY